MLKRRRGTVAPVTFLLVGVYLLAGCIYIPAFQLPKDGKDFRNFVGDAHTRKPIRSGEATRAAVIERLGQPIDFSSDRRVIAYEFGATNGYWVWPLCFMVNSEHTYYRLRLTFDDNDILQRYDIDTSDDKSGTPRFWPLLSPGPTPGAPGAPIPRDARPAPPADAPRYQTPGR